MDEGEVGVGTEPKGNLEVELGYEGDMEGEVE